MRLNKKSDELVIPSVLELEKELKREIYKSRYKKLLGSTISVLVVVAAISVLIATLFFPVLRIYGSSMSPTLVGEDIVLCIKKNDYNSGDIVAFYYNNKILVKRVIGKEYEFVYIDKEGSVFVNNQLLDEGYIEKKAYGNVDIEFPYQVPEGSYFILGDKRESSIDSRNSLIGTIKAKDMIGKVIFRVWPLNKFGIIK